ncbi:hypothetical protein BH11MYX2_BH11MYX2_04010 [soil metagenome]
MARGAEAKFAVPILTKCASTAPTARKPCDIVLTIALDKTKDWTAMETHLKAWGAREPASTFPSSFWIASLADQKRYTDADAGYGAAYAKFPTDNCFSSHMKGSPPASLRNNYGWLLSVPRRDLPHALELVTAAVSRSPPSRSTSTHVPQSRWSKVTSGRPSRISLAPCGQKRISLRSWHRRARSTDWPRCRRGRQATEGTP